MVDIDKLRERIQSAAAEELALIEAESDAWATHGKAAAALRDSYAVLEVASCKVRRKWYEVERLIDQLRRAQVAAVDQPERPEDGRLLL